MNRIFVLLTFLLICLGCSNSSAQKKVSTTLTIADLKLLHRFVNDNNICLGDLFGKIISDSTFSDFIIVRKVDDQIVPIFTIEKSTFQNIYGKENLPINSKDFYGYHILVLSKKGMGLEPLFMIQNKILKGDPINVVWDQTIKAFNVLITP
jgi:hypothetical protein